MYGKMQESGLPEIIPFIGISGFLTVGSGCSLMAAALQVFFLSAFRAHQLIFNQFSSVQWLSSARLCNPVDCSMPAPGVYSDSRPLSLSCHPTISSSVVPFSSHLQYERVAQLSLMTVTPLFTAMAGNNPLISHI